MPKLTSLQQKNRKAILKDKTLPFAVRKKAHDELIESMLNPKAKKDFDPETFDPMEDVDDFDVKRRPRQNPPRLLPTNGLRPKAVLEGQLVGMYESKQDLYLLIAYAYERITLLEDKLEKHGLT